GPGADAGRLHARGPVRGGAALARQSRRDASPAAGIRAPAPGAAPRRLGLGGGGDRRAAGAARWRDRGSHGMSRRALRIARSFMPEGADGGLFPIDRKQLRVAGVDEAGRGPLAGPVAVAAVVLDPRRRIRGLDDSKKLSHAQREDLYPRIVERALAWHVELVPVDEIDRLNILQATLEGMRRCVLALGEHAQLARIDGNMLPRSLPCMAEAIIGGDALEPAIMAASILAKV